MKDHRNKQASTIRIMRNKQCTFFNFRKTHGLKLLLLLLLTSSILTSCTPAFFNKIASTSYQSRFNDSSVWYGMNKKQFIAQFGEPFKKSFSKDEHNILHETLYYKEQLYLNRWYTVNTIFHFKDDVLISQEQGKEELLYEDRCPSCQDNDDDD